MTTMPTISVIIPAFNAQATIKETIASVQAQTFSDFEIIVIDDGSTDNTLKILQQITDSRLRIFSYSNGGTAVARNRGISQATGDYIAFLDADDLWTPNKLERQLQALKTHPEAGVAYSWTYFLDEIGNKSYADTSTSYEGYVYAYLIVTNFLHNGSNPLILKQAIDTVGLFDQALHPCEDWDFYIRLASIYPFVLIPEPQVVYRQARGTATSKIELIEKKMLNVIDRAFRAAPSNLQHLKRHSIAGVYKYLIQQYLKYEKGNYDYLKFATENLLKAISIQPTILLEEYTQGLVRHIAKQWFLFCKSVFLFSKQC
jgi:glycosyltransferase involved in cell wall biosynthesis